MKRITICLEDKIFASLDRITAQRGFSSRSKAISEFVRRAAFDKKFKNDSPCLGFYLLKTGVQNAGDVSSWIKKLAKKISKEAVYLTETERNKKSFIFFSLEGSPQKLQEFSDSLTALKKVSSCSFLLNEL